MSHLRETPGISLKTRLRALEFCYIQSCISKTRKMRFDQKRNGNMVFQVYTHINIRHPPVLLVVEMVPKLTNLHHAQDLPELHALHSLTCRTVLGLSFLAAYVYQYASTSFYINLSWLIYISLRFNLFLPHMIKILHQLIS